MANLRPATADDLVSLVRLASAMHTESPRFRIYPFLPARMYETLRLLFEIKHGFLMVAEVGGEIVGAFAGMAGPHFACDVLQANDIGLFIAPEHRGGTTAARLVRAYLDWARSIGAEPTISINTGVAVERTGKLLESLGAVNSGTNWTWGI